MANPGGQSAQNGSPNAYASSGCDRGKPGSTALFQLATELPAALLARMLGIHISVAVAWQHASAGDWTNYAADYSRRQTFQVQRCRSGPLHSTRSDRLARHSGTVPGRVRPGSDRGGGVLVSAPAPVLPPDLTAGLRRLKLAAMRQLAPELLLTAKTQRWALEEILRTLIEAEIASLDASNTRARLKAAALPVVKTIEEFDLAASSIPAPTWDYLTSLEWISAKANLALIGQAGTSHALIALGYAAVHAAHRVRYFTAPDLVETLYRSLADNSVGKTIDTLLRNDLLIIDEVDFAPLDDTGTQLLFRLVAAAYERRALAIASHWSFEKAHRFDPRYAVSHLTLTGAA